MQLVLLSSNSRERQTHSSICSSDSSLLFLFLLPSSHNHHDAQDRPTHVTNQDSDFAQDILRPIDLVTTDIDHQNLLLLLDASTSSPPPHPRHLSLLDNTSLPPGRLFHTSTTPPPQRPHHFDASSRSLSIPFTPTPPRHLHLLDANTSSTPPSPRRSHLLNAATYSHPRILLK